MSSCTHWVCGDTIWRRLRALSGSHWCSVLHKAWDRWRRQERSKSHHFWDADTMTLTFLKSFKSTLWKSLDCVMTAQVMLWKREREGERIKVKYHRQTNAPVMERVERELVSNSEWMNLSAGFHSPQFAPKKETKQPDGIIFSPVRKLFRVPQPPCLSLHSLHPLACCHPSVTVMNRLEWDVWYVVA